MCQVLGLVWRLQSWTFTSLLTVPICLDLHQHQFWPFLPRFGETWVCRPEWCWPSHLPSPLWLFCLLGSFLSREHAVLRLGEDARWGMGPRVRFHRVGHFPTWHSDCISPPPTPVSQYTEFILNALSSSVCHVFLLRFWKSPFFLVALQMTLLTWDRWALVAPAGCQWPSNLFVGAHRKNPCYIGTQYTCWYMWMYGFP